MENSSLTFGRRRTRSPATDVERRDAPSEQTSAGSRIIMAAGKSVRCCIVNISKSDALLLVPPVLALPEHCDLQDNAGRVRRVQVVRRETSRIAVRFL